MLVNKRLMRGGMENCKLIFTIKVGNWAQGVGLELKYRG